ncbi:hypothetical protein CRUP_016810 [Coryphaenoides rupestris]|nr:hypothetical protein CRUP_016810 [Coryphaenoides rupestris]
MHFSIPETEVRSGDNGSTYVIFTLTPAEVEQRREHLEKYMQAVRQDPLLGTSELFNCFLRKAQQETQQIPTEEVSLEVGLSNGQKVTVNILTSDQTEDVLETIYAGKRAREEFKVTIKTNG